MFKRIITAIFLVVLFSLPAFSHELTIKNVSGKTPEVNQPFSLTVQSAHKFIVPEEVEILSRVKAGIIENGKLIEAQRIGERVNYDIEMLTDRHICLDQDLDDLVNHNQHCHYDGRRPSVFLFQLADFSLD